LICEPLSDDALQCAVGAGNVIDAERHAVRIAKIELGKVAMQVLFLAMLIDAFHAAFKDRIVAFNAVGVDHTAHIFLDAVFDRRMAGKHGA